MISIEFCESEIQLPKYLVQNPHVIKTIVSSETWNKVLTRDQKVHLLKFLPTFPTNDTEEKIATLKLLFNDAKLNFENPRDTFIKKLKEKEFHPASRSRRVIDLIMKERLRVRSLLSSRLQTLRDIMDKKQSQGLELNENELVCYNKWTRLLTETPNPERISQERMSRLIAKIETKVVAGRVNDSDQESDVNSESNLMRSNPDEFMNRLVANHRQNLLLEPEDHPELDTRGVSLVNIRRSVQDDRMNYQKEDDNSSNASENESQMSGDHLLLSIDEPSTEDEESIGIPVEEKTDFICPTWPQSNFFLLLQGFFKQAVNAKLTTVQVEERVREWQEKRRKTVGKDNRAADFGWIDRISDWVNVTTHAMRYLCAESGQCQPYIEYKPRLHLWRWIGPIDNSDSHTEVALSQLFGEWIDNKDRMSFEEVKQSEEEEIPLSYCPTDYSIDSSEKRDVQSFRIQEAERFNSFSRPYVYRCEGDYLATVGPVAQIQKSTKARGHALLRSDRPAVVNLVEIVRDAVARLPNGEGSKQDIVTLALDSGYWVPRADVKQISQCISSALDRLQCESVDPPVKYISVQKLWIYRHRHRTPEDFQRLYHQQKALETAKLSQKSGKVRSGPPNRSDFMTNARKSKPSILSNQKASTSGQSWGHWPPMSGDDYFEEDLDDEFSDDMWNNSRDKGSDDDDDEDIYGYQQ